MKVKCTNCHTALNIDNAKFTVLSILIACPKCQQQMRVEKPSSKIQENKSLNDATSNKEKSVAILFQPQIKNKFFGILKYSIAALLFFGIFKFYNSVDWNSKPTFSTPDNSSKEDDIYSTDNSFTCPHCDGTGKRVNGLTGEYGSCSSCSGLGKVNKWKHDHYVKNYSGSSVNNNSVDENSIYSTDYSYNCPHCGGSGRENNFTGVMEQQIIQTTCPLCFGKGKVNKYFYENGR